MLDRNRDLSRVATRIAQSIQVVHVDSIQHPAASGHRLWQSAATDNLIGTYNEGKYY